MVMNSAVKMTRLAFVHTVPFLVDDFRAKMRTTLPHIDCFHVLNESLLQDLLRGAPKEEIYRRVVGQIALTADAGADLIVVTCSSTSPAVDLARREISLPILKIDDPMANQAVRTGKRIGLICTATSTVEPSSSLLQAHAQDLGREITIVPLLKADAYAALIEGDRAGHDAIILEAAVQASATCDVIVLAQASLAHLRDELAARMEIPVLASPTLLMREIEKRWASIDSPVE